MPIAVDDHHGAGTGADALSDLRRREDPSWPPPPAVADEDHRRGRFRPGADQLRRVLRDDEVPHDRIGRHDLRHPREHLQLKVAEHDEQRVRVHRAQRGQRRDGRPLEDDRDRQPVTGGERGRVP
jgi:hypothetical protein